MAEPGDGSPASSEPGLARDPRNNGPRSPVKRPTWTEVAKLAPRQSAWTSHRISPRKLEVLQERFSEVVKVPEEELEEMRSKWRSSTVLVRSMGRNVPADWVAKEVRRAGKLDYDVGSFTLVDSVIAVRFANESDRESAMANGPWMVAGQLPAMERWRPNFIPGIEGVGWVVVWLRLPGLPLDYWKKETIFRIAARAENPLALDECMEKRRTFGFARVKMEVDVSAPLKPGTMVMGRSVGREVKFWLYLWQGFVYENLPVPCPKCGRIGHSAAVCESSSPVEVGADPVVETSGSEEGATEKPAANVPNRVMRDGKRSEEEGLYGPWLMTNQIGPSLRAPRKEAAGSGARKKPVPSPRVLVRV
ncbi:uncharacterized protein LOC103699569 [Phoenix dactylifera]|uniref:Uncharacterized protein LOC103699569 n=1 Tax=Phoenix dactylifera TaxID=42345 RepID=A0A8B7BKN2_PHODC|nr:uncharacterized protein LOC103699569 [Phoenix dactylifera]